MTHGKWIIH